MQTEVKCVYIYSYCTVFTSSSLQVIYDYMRMGISIAVQRSLPLKRRKKIEFVQKYLLCAFIDSAPGQVQIYELVELNDWQV